MSAEPLTHVPLCAVDGCPWPGEPDWHIPICKHGLAGHHHHVIKRSRGSYGREGIQVFICPRCHDKIDNGHWGNAVIQGFPGWKYVLFNELGKELVCEDITRWVVGEGRGSGAADACEDTAFDSRVVAVSAPLSDHRLFDVDATLDSDPNKTEVRTILYPRSEHRPQDAPERPQDEAVTTCTPGPIVWAEMPQDEPYEPVFHSPGLPEFPDVSQEEGRLILRDGLPFERFEEIVQSLEYIQRNLNWYIGDALAYGERTYGEECYQAFSGFERMGFGIERLRQCGWVAERVLPSTRIPALSWSHHRAVAALPEPQQAEWLGRAVEEDMTVNELRECVATKREKPECEHEWVNYVACSKCKAIKEE